MLVSILTGWFGKRAGVVLAHVLPYVLGALLVAGVVWYIRADAYDDGVVDTTLKYEALIDDERERLNAANEAAMEEATRIIRNLEARVRERNLKIEELSNAARQDPNADRPAFGPDSLRRLDSVR